MTHMPFLVEGTDGATPLQAYCTVHTPLVITIDTIYPLKNIHIIMNGEDETKLFGDNEYTRETVIREFRRLRRIYHGVMHFYHRYRAVLKRYEEIESMEFARYKSMDFATQEQRSEYSLQMHHKLRDIYVHYLQKAIPEVRITPDCEYVIQPYLLIQILDTIDAKEAKKLSRLRTKNIN